MKIVHLRNLLLYGILFFGLGHQSMFAQGTFLSDDFHTGTLNSSLWTFVNPNAPSTLSFTGMGTSDALLSIALPAGGDGHDVWGANGAPRIMQTVSNNDFLAEVKFQSTLDAVYQMQGIIVEQDAQNYVRFDFLRDPGGIKVFAASISGGSPSQRLITGAIAGSNPSWLRVERVGSTWTCSYSANGTTFTTAGTFSQSLTVSMIGPFAGNAIGSSSPAFTMLCDYFFNTATPIEPEDPTGPPEAPSITQQPTDQTVDIGQSATFSVVSAGSPTPAYQWQKNSIDIAGATSASYTTPSTVQGDSGSNFRCIVSNSVGTVTSNSAQLSLTYPVPTITQQPANQIVYVGSSASFTVAATGAQPFAYQWQKNGLSVSGATNSSYVIQSTVSGDNGAAFRCIVSNVYGSATSNTALLTVNNLPTGPVSDDFSLPALNSMWTPVNPLGDATFALTGTGTSNAYLNINVPAGTSHDVWTGGNKAPRVMQPIPNGDFEVEVKFESQLTAQFQVQGIIVQQDNNNYIRFDFLYDGANVRIFSASFSNGNPTTRYDVAIAPSPFLYMRVKRVSNQWTQSYSYAGTSWIAAANFSYALTVGSIGPFAGNAGGNPAFTALVDYFFNTASPYLPEDYTGPPGPPAITQQPTNQTVVTGQTATFVVAVQGTVPFAYQWQKNNTNIAGATSALYTTPAAVHADSGSAFRCIVTNAEGEATSNTAYLFVTSPPPQKSIAASQIGYSPTMKKQFSSPASFTSFGIVRISDSTVVYTGGLPVRNVASSVVGNARYYIGDFSSFTTPGRYKIVVNGNESYPFNIGTDIFAGPLRAAQRFFYYQRAFTAIESQFAEGPWVHPTDIAKAPAGVVKGWHDAGDLAIYMPTMAQAIWWLLESWMDFQPTSDNWNIPESGNGIPDILDETRWGIEWIRTQQDASGAFWGSSCAGGNNSYPYGSTTPNTVGAYAKTISPTTQNTAKAIAALAYASKVYQPYDATFAASCLSAARAGWAWMVANPNSTNDGGNCSAYAQGSDATLLKTNKMWAAAAMLYATGESQFETAFQSYYSAINWISSYSLTNGFAGKMYLRCTTNANAATQNTIRQSILQQADYARSDASGHPFQWAGYYYWGANSNAAHRSGQFSWQAYRMDTTRTADRDQLLDNVHYLFGRNFYKLSFMSGSETWGATNVRNEGFHQWMKALHATPFHFPGAIAGGPNEAPPSDDISYPGATPYPVYGYFGDPRYPRDGTTVTEGRFTDNDSWSTNEIAINWQGAVIYTLYAANWVATNGAPVGPPDTLAPVISSIQAGNIGSASATISWSTNENSTSLVEYGTTVNYGPTATAGGYVSNHSVSLSGLLANTLYYYRVKSVDPSGNSTTSAGKSFRTGISVDYAATGTTITRGTLNSGNVASLASLNGNYYVLNSSSGGNPKVIDWYASTTIAEAPSTISALTVTLDVKYSRANVAQTAYLYNWLTSSWTQIDSRKVGTSDVLIEFAQTPSTNFISSGGQIRLRLLSSGSTSRTCSTDWIRFRVETNGSSLTKPVENTSVVVSASLPTEFSLQQNFPNPFNPTTNIRYGLPVDGFVTLRVFDILGREVATLVSSDVPAGFHDVVFDASQLASGVYFYRIEAKPTNGNNQFTLLKKMLLLK